MLRTLFTSLTVLGLALPASGQWDAVTHQPTNMVHTEGFLIVHDDGTNLMAFSAMAQEWMVAAPGGSDLLESGDFCALFRRPGNELSAYSARLHEVQVAPIPVGANVLDLRVSDDVALILYQDGGDMFALGYSAQTNYWDLLSLGPVSLPSLEYGADRFVLAVSDGSRLAGFSARVGAWSISRNDSALNLRFDGNVVVADVVPTPGAGTCAAAFSGVLGSWSVSPQTHLMSSTELDHNVAWAMMDSGVDSVFHHGTYSAYTGAWVISSGSYLVGNWTAQLQDNLVLLLDTFSERYIAFGARPGVAQVPVPTNGPWSLVLLTEDALALLEVPTQDVYGFSGLIGTAFVPQSMAPPVAAVNGPTHSLHVRDGSGTLFSFGPAHAAWTPGLPLASTAVLSPDDAVHIVEDVSQYMQYSTRNNSWGMGPPLYPSANYSVATGGSVIAVQEDLATSGDLRIYSEGKDRWTMPLPQSAELDMYPGRNLVMFVDSSTGEVSAYSAQTTSYTTPPPSLTPGVVYAGSVPTVDENVGWFTDGASIVAFGSPGELHTWHQWPRGTEFQAWAGATPTTLDASIRTSGPNDTRWVGSPNLRPSPIVIPPSSLLWMDPPYTIIGTVTAQPVGGGSTHLAHHAISAPASPPLVQELWTQGLLTLPPGSLSPWWWLTAPYAEPAWIF